MPLSRCGAAAWGGQVKNSLRRQLPHPRLAALNPLAPPTPRRSTFSLHLDQQGAGPAIALLRSNLMRTRYGLEPGPGCAWLHRVLEGAGYGPAEELAAAPPALAGVRYKIRVRGMMMPRR
jgi:hypothetical protein